MNLRTAALIGIAGLRIPTCFPSSGPSSYAYTHTEHLPLPSGDTLTVYRVAYVSFLSGGAPAVEFEYEAPLAIDGPTGNDPFTPQDKATVLHQARAIWPYVAGYVTAQGVSQVYVIPSTFHSWGLFPWAQRTMVASFPLIADRGKDGSWRFEQDTALLPAGDSTARPQVVDVDGKPLPFAFPRTSDHLCKAASRTPLICVLQR